MRNILFLFLFTFLFADERCYFAVDMSYLPDQSREIVFENILERGLQGRKPSGHSRDITHYGSNPDDSKRLVQGTFNEQEITWFFNIPYVEFIGYNIGVNKAEQRVLDYLHSTDWYKAEVSSVSVGDEIIIGSDTYTVIGTTPIVIGSTSLVTGTTYYIDGSTIPVVVGEKDTKTGFWVLLGGGIVGLFRGVWVFLRKKLGK